MMSLPLRSDILTKRGAAHAMDGAPTTRPLGLPPHADVYRCSSERWWTNTGNEE